MKQFILIFLLCAVILKTAAQDNQLVKPNSIAFHVFYTDFKTAQQIKASSLSDVLNHGKWSGFRDMQMGFGLNYFKKINPWLTAAATVDGSGIDYVFKDGTSNGTSKFLLDLNAGLNATPFKATQPVAPYFFGGAGFSYYTKKAGIYFPIGIGVQINLFNEAFIVSNMQYRFAGSQQVNDHFYYTIGLGTSIGKTKQAKPIAQNEVPIAIAPIRVADVKIVEKTVRVKVVDEQTNLPLPQVNVRLYNANENFNAVSDQNGEVSFSAIRAGAYTISGMFHEIATNIQVLQPSNFDGNGEITVILQHNDPRFTLVGTVINQTTNQPIPNISVSVLSKTDGSTNVFQNQSDGSFMTQISAGNEFVIFAKKTNFISNVETISTMGLNRSTTLYVKLALGMEETRQNATINLKNIYYQAGSAVIQPSSSADLQKLILFLTDNPNVKIEINSHTDSRGTASSNLVLSQKRAQEVSNYLKNHGIAANRVIAKGYGETMLINRCGLKCTELQHEQNRRTEFRILGN
jgi:outer membrane protein OmpA-like peptidoglycan-associated protein